MSVVTEIPIIIPAYEPDIGLVELVEKMKKRNLKNIIIVDDGSGEEYRPIFEKVQKEGCVILRHCVNLGKGRALKTGFNYCINTFPNTCGCITADSDGQHTPEDIYKCMTELCNHQETLILGSRNFDQEDVPYKSKMGNKMTRKICKWLCGIAVTDTQTGLRGIPTSFMKYLMNIPGERFEFETNMLLETKNKCNIQEVIINTVYDSKDNHTTHFDPIKDSIRIYKIFGRIFLKFIFSSLSASILDIILFALFCAVFQYMPRAIYLALAAIIARVVSAIYNFWINYAFVFKSEENYFLSTIKYFTLAIVQMGFSIGGVVGMSFIFNNAPEVLIKICVDTILFFFSYWIQREFVFCKKMQKH